VDEGFLSAMPGSRNGLGKAGWRRGLEREGKPDAQGAKRWISSMSEIPVRFVPRRLADWLNPTGARKAHSLIDKIYKRKNLEMAWEKVKANAGAGGVDGREYRDV
jgi:hypothetical protein